MDICHRLDPDCKSCGKPVYWKKRIFYLNRLWHLDCFKCSRCKVRLNTDVEEKDTKYSKAFLGEDFALRCNVCDEIFEKKKQLKQAYKKNLMDNKLMNHLFNYNEHHLVHQANQENLKKTMPNHKPRHHVHKCMATDCKCLKARKCFKNNDETDLSLSLIHI